MRRLAVAPVAAGSSTFVESIRALPQVQIHLFMQNKANLLVMRTA